MACLLTCEQDSGQLGRDGGGQGWQRQGAITTYGGEGQWEGGVAGTWGQLFQGEGPGASRGCSDGKGEVGTRYPSRSPELRLPWVQPIWGTKLAEKDGEWTGRGTRPSAFSIHPCSVGDMCPQHPGRTMLR